MPRGVTYAQDNQVSDNAIEAGPTKVHGTNPEHDHLGRVDRTAPLPEDMGNPEPYIGQRDQGHGSGKGGHEPKTL
ncbi:hypothetical protein COL922a_014976, partial [Colletotrichum nupharicola]